MTTVTQGAGLYLRKCNFRSIIIFLLFFILQIATAFRVSCFSSTYSHLRNQRVISMKAWPSIFHNFLPSPRSKSRICHAKRKSIAVYCSIGPIISDETYEEWLDDIIYSGDIEGYIRRRSKDLVDVDFLEYLEERITMSQDSDEKQVLIDITKVVQDFLRKSDGLEDSAITFEKRLDRILFCAPANRRAMIVEKIDEMTEGFVDYIQREIQSSDDSDIKVVLASILQMIGQAKNVDLLSNSSVDLSRISEITAEKTDSADAALSTNLSDNNEKILAGFVFSKNDILEDVLNNLHYINDQFVKFLQNKIDKSRDMEERVALGSLLDTITTVLDRVKEVQGDNAVDAINEELTMEQVKEKMKAVQSGREVDSNAKDSKLGYATKDQFEIKSDKIETFKGILDRFINLPPETSLLDVVKSNYELCDKDFMEMLKKEATSCLDEGADIEAKQYLDILDVINQLMAEKISAAQVKLQRVLSKPTQMAMETEVIAMIRRNEVDEAFVLLIEGNIQQAEAAGATQAVTVLRAINDRITYEKERALPDEQRLIRALLREKSEPQRKSLLYEAFKPSKSLDDDNQVVTGPPLISPPSFIIAVRRIIQDIGNVDTYKIMDRMTVIINEAQIVATELYGEGMTPREQQKFMFEKRSVSVWDLASFEESAEMSGEDVPWRNDKYDNMMPEDVLQEQRVKSIGGLDSD